jgi:hypothetical protein
MRNLPIDKCRLSDGLISLSWLISSAKVEAYSALLAAWIQPDNPELNCHAAIVSAARNKASADWSDPKPLM